MWGPPKCNSFMSQKASNRLHDVTIHDCVLDNTSDTTSVHRKLLNREESQNALIGRRRFCKFGVYLGVVLFS